MLFVVPTRPAKHDLLPPPPPEEEEQTYDDASTEPRSVFPISVYFSCSFNATATEILGVSTRYFVLFSHCDHVVCKLGDDTYLLQGATGTNSLKLLL